MQTFNERLQLKRRNNILQFCHGILFWNTSIWKLARLFYFFFWVTSRATNEDHLWLMHKIQQTPSPLLNGASRNGALHLVWTCAWVKPDQAGNSCALAPVLQEKKGPDPEIRVSHVTQIHYEAKTKKGQSHTAQTSSRMYMAVEINVLITINGNSF